MRKLVIILIAFLAVITFIRAFANSEDIKNDAASRRADTSVDFVL
jgi:hypothetical protein